RGGVIGGRKVEQVSLSKSEAGAMRKKIANHQFIGDRWVGQAKRRHVLDDRVVPRELAFVYEDGERGSRKSFRVRSDAEEGIFRNWCRIAKLADAISFRVNDLSILHYGE